MVLVIWQPYNVAKYEKTRNIGVKGRDRFQSLYMVAGITKQRSWYKTWELRPKSKVLKDILIGKGKKRGEGRHVCCSALRLEESREEHSLLKTRPAGYREDELHN